MISSKINNFFFKGSERTVLVKKNIAANLIIKGLSILVGLLYVPITLNYLNPTRYGVWMTLTSIVAWIGFFDIGLGNGLRNKLSEALLSENKTKAKKYVSTAYAMLSLIMIFVIVVFLIANNWIPWGIVLNSPDDYDAELSKLALVVIVLFGLKFIFVIISTIFTANQLPSVGSALELVGNTLGLISIWIITQTNHTSLIAFGFAAMLAPVLVYLFASIYFFNTKYAAIKPSWDSIDLSKAREISDLGIQFFIIQIAVLVIFQTSNILIVHFFSPTEVTKFNIAFKYFGVLTMIWGIIMTPLWSAFTQANALNDISWMRKTILNLNKLMIITIFVLCAMAFSAKYIITIWTNGQVDIQTPMIWIFALYSLISIWNNIYAFFLNGTNNVKIQIYTSVIASIVHLPLTFILIKWFNFGSEGVVLSMAISLSFFAIAGPIQSFKTLKILI